MKKVVASAGRVARRGKIVYSLLMLMLLAGLAPLFLTSAWLILKNREELAIQEQVLQLDQTRSIAQQARLYLQAMHNQILAIAQTFEIGGDPRRVPSRIASVLNSQKLINYIQEQSHILAITVYDHEGRYLSAGVSLDDPTLVQYLRQSYLEALGGRPWVSPPHVSEPLLDTVVVISSPVFSNSPRTVAGVVSAMISLQPIQELVEAMIRGERDVYIVDGEGQLIAHSHRETLFTRPDFSRTVMVQAFQESRGQASSSVNFVQTEAGVTRAMVGTYTPIGDPSSRVPLLAELNWGVIVQAKEEEVYATVRGIVNSSIFVAVLSAALAIFLALIFAGRLSQPISRLAEGARGLASGDFTTNIEVSSRNEIGELADTFNLMTAEIRNFIEKLRRAAQENKEMFVGAVRSLAAAIDAKDPYTRGHSERVSHYSEVIARTLGLPEKEVEVVRIGALMHDVGKIGIEDKVLGKAGPLTEEEFDIMKSHPVKGAIIIEPVRQLKEMIPPMKHHHENLDGSGYPDGLKGEEIPLHAMIVSVADTFDAMTTNRPYQKAMEITYVFERMRSFVGKKFSKEIVEALIRAYEEGLIRPDFSMRPMATPKTAAGKRQADKKAEGRRPVATGVVGSGK